VHDALQGVAIECLADNVNRICTDCLRNMPGEGNNLPKIAPAATVECRNAALNAARRTASRVPAYFKLLSESGVSPSQIASLDDFAKLPVLTKANTFQRFPIEQLCVDGEIGRLGSVLTSSGHSGVFAFGLNGVDSYDATADWIDDLLDSLFQVRSEPTLLINCLPMGVKVPTKSCTLAETSVRPDMAIGLVQAFAGRHFSQVILVGEAAFVKHLLEEGIRAGVRWPSLRVHVILGEEPLAENARKYIESILEVDSCRDGSALVFSSMGVGEVGLNLFSEVPPAAPLIHLRRLLHENTDLRHAVLGPRDWVPSLFTYDLRRILVEFDLDGRLLLTTLDPNARVPLIRYATGDQGSFFAPPQNSKAQLEAAGVSPNLISSLPIVMIEGRGNHAAAGTSKIYPEAVKEGIYLEPELAMLTTANFRISAGRDRGVIRIQLSKTRQPTKDLSTRFFDAINHYVRVPIEVQCESYHLFASGMTLDYERKFDYLGP
jgi:phenylacetate-CoA ligase